MKRTGVTTRYWMATLALASLLATALAGAQSQGTTPQDRDSDLSWRQLSAFDQFLDSHPEVSDQLRKDPSLVNNDEFVENITLEKADALVDQWKKELGIVSDTNASDSARSEGRDGNIKDIGPKTEIRL